jgi:hypothetical protein
MAGPSQPQNTHSESVDADALLTHRQLIVMAIYPLLVEVRIHVS